MAYGSYNYLEQPLSEGLEATRNAGRSAIDTARRGKEGVQTRLSQMAGSTGPTRNRPSMPNINMPNINMPDVSVPESVKRGVVDWASRRTEPMRNVWRGGMEDMTEHFNEGRYGSAYATLPRTMLAMFPALASSIGQQVEPLVSNVADAGYTLFTGQAPQGDLLARGDRFVNDVLQGTRDAATPSATAATNTGAGTPGQPATDPERGYIKGLQSGRTAALGDDPRNPVNYVDYGWVNPATGRSVDEEFAEANRIRQGTVDMLSADGGGGRVINLGPTEIESTRSAINDLYRQAASTRDIEEKILLSSQAEGLEDQLGSMMGMDETALRERGALQRSMISNQGIGPLRAATAQNYLANSMPEPTGMSQNEAMTALIESGLLSADIEKMSPAESAMLQQLGMAAGIFAPPGQEDETRNYASGGYVSPTPSAVSGPLGRATPALQPNAAMQAYQQYVDGARSMGLNTVPFEQFMQLQRGASATAAGAAGQPPIGFEQGGVVPDASGKLVIDSNPNAPTDSIPAVIDGQQAARLDSGEFVFPEDVVLHFGTDKLKKMIEQARNAGGDTNGTRSAISAGV